MKFSEFNECYKVGFGVLTAASMKMENSGL
jgi:hypothetical protein